ncbi:MAG: alanine dehydrogenase [Nitrospinota bacterium]
MIIGVPRESKRDEHRVALVPPAVEVLTSAGHTVLIEEGAGQGSGIEDREFQRAGARVVPSAGEVWRDAELLVKVKEPLPAEFPRLREGLVLFAFLHLAASQRLARRLMRAKVRAVAFETVRLADGSLPLLQPMSEIAGRMAVQLGARYLERAAGGPGILLGGAPGVPRGEVMILGGGIVGRNAAKIAVGLGAGVTVLDIDHARLQYLDDVFGGRVKTLASNRFNIRESVRRADLVVGGVLVPGARAPVLVDRAMVRAMRPGSVVVDVAVDQGGCVETIRPTYHSRPTYVAEGVTHYGVTNMPGGVPRTSTFALSNAILPYALELANLGLEEAVRAQPMFAEGVNVYRGKLTHPAVAEAVGGRYTPLERLI